MISMQVSTASTYDKHASQYSKQVVTKAWCQAELEGIVAPSEQF